MLAYFEHLKELSAMRQCIASGFPSSLQKDACRVLALICNRAYVDTSRFCAGNAVSFRLSDGQRIAVADRICLDDSFSVALTDVQQTIYHCILTRSHDGYCRERHLQALFREEIPEWVFPYLLKMSDDYVVEIVQTLYRSLQQHPLPDFPSFCRNNLQQFLRCHDRMISYWNEFYRFDCPRYRNYVGRALFSECLGYQKQMEKLRISENKKQTF